ncbi:prephenate dehydratase [Corynebacterium cystitidis]|uniref:Prephenate dehydratase n=1 Tax=Corynebacterium cystitidis DSM 20524 TaxID=1121357 RepID=A0A1H9TDL4_9CORY|nr:prephenate dehydratase [Corynebacterium cystitidis]WJY83574.1 Prephenate dehydratase [Corynebacterium cystitidis DSM 20524]SER95292.1 prephenate dehydratase [Corynebacterium cystitidis DSM 20524]SNV91961.1 prephenate dehydratase [Corynebacterium cystitidis]
MTTVAFLGPAGTFTEEALWKFQERGAFGSGEIELLPVDSPSAALSAVRADAADWAVVAIENSVDGAVTSTTDALIEAPGVQIFHELELPISFAIMTRPGTTLKEAQVFSTHPVAQRQVRDWVKNNMPHVTYTGATSNAVAAQAVAEGKADVAAAPLRAANLFGLEVHAEGIADLATAHTRFIVVGRVDKPTARTGNDRSFVVFDLPNEPGTLVGALQEFAYRGVNMSRIESRPTRKEARTYNFYVDLVGHIDDAPLAEALRNLWLRANTLTFLGSWPAASGEAREGSLIDDQARLEEAADWVRKAREGH